MEHQHKRFDEELADLRARVIEMGRLVAEQIEGALWCLSDHDTRGAHLMIDCDTGVNEMDHEIEERCFELLALHQPVAVDLRFITATMKISTELERLGDRAVKICEAVHDLGENDSVKLDAQIAQLGALVTGMISESLRAFTQLDSSLAEGVFDTDKKFAALYSTAFAKLTSASSGHAEKALHRAKMALFFRDMNEISEHATNIAEVVIFMVRGNEITHMDFHERRIG